MASAFRAKRQHIQDHASAENVELHWGYPDRVVPCTNDAGSCEYLDGVYWMHDVSMLYSFIMWAVIGGVLVIAIAVRCLKPSPKKTLQVRGSESQNTTGSSAYYRGWRGVQVSLRRWLLPESMVGFFGHVTRLQILVLAILLGYLLIFSLVGIVYQTWTTPVKKTNLFNTRTGLGGFSDRVGVLAYALTPLTVALSTRESILTLLTGIPYQSFNFLHQWLGRIIFVQSAIHTLGWTIIEGKLYQPQPTVYTNFIKQLYMVWGCIAMLFITFLYIFSLQRVIKWTGHEFFRKTHYVVAMLYIGACWGHWSRLACWMIASLGLWGVDRGVRFLRTILIHTGQLNSAKGFGFHPAQSSVQYFDDEDGGAVRMEFKHNHDGWAVGQHFFLCFPALTIWQSHPFTVATVPTPHPALPRHTYIARCRDGETARLKALALTQENAESKTATTPVILCGPYGENLLPMNVETTNILAIAGGTGVSLTLPLALATTASPAFAYAAIDFVWIIRRSSNTQWIASELEELKRRAQLNHSNLRVHIYITQEKFGPGVLISPAAGKKASLDIGATPISASSSTVASLENGSEKGNFTLTFMDSHHPALHIVVSTFLEMRAESAYRTRVVASGPRSMGSDLRIAVASSNHGVKVWKDRKRWDVSLEWDDRG